MLDPDSRARAHFRGLTLLPARSRVPLQARSSSPYPALKTVPVPNVLGQLVPMESPGLCRVHAERPHYRLEPVYETSRHERSVLHLQGPDQPRPTPTRPAATCTRRCRRTASSIWTSTAPTTRLARSPSSRPARCRRKRTSSRCAIQAGRAALSRCSEVDRCAATAPGHADVTRTSLRREVAATLLQANTARS